MDNDREENETGEGMFDAANNEIVGLEFDSIDSAFEFYKTYGYDRGVSVRRSTTRNDKEGKRIVQEFCCSNAGMCWTTVKDEDRKRRPRPTTRTGCEARVQFKLVGEAKWKLAFAAINHNHDVCHPKHAHFLRAQRHVNEADLAEAIALKASGMRPKNIYNYFVQSRGGYQNVGFLAKDLYNALDAETQAEVRDGDVEALIACFSGKEDSDMGLYMKYTVDEENRMHNMFWCDSISRSDYSCFGDVIAFDTTYKNNAYDRPLMPIVGLNHQHQTVIFGIAVLADQTTNSFEWVLTTFLDAMGNKVPRSVVTDGDRAMEKAIRSTMPSAAHRLCSWHLSRNAQTNICDPNFVRHFTKCMQEWWTPNQFEDYWNWMVMKFNVQNHPWVKEKYRTRHMWAQAYLTGHFFATLTSTQTCESMNASIGRYLSSKKTYLEFVRAIEQGIAAMRHNEAEMDYKSSQTKPHQSTVLKDLETHGAEVYTRSSFCYFQQELEYESLYTLAEPVTRLLSIESYYLLKYKSGGRRIKVDFDTVSRTMRCECDKFETIGFPCAHQLHVLKEADIPRLPESFILPMWTKNVKLNIPTFVEGVDIELIRRRRFGSLASRSNQMIYIGSLTDESYIKVGSVIDQTTAELVKSSNIHNSNEDTTAAKGRVQDPLRRRAKGKENVNKVAKLRKCGQCGNIGHNKTTCPELALNLRGNHFHERSTYGGDEQEIHETEPPNFHNQVSDTEATGTTGRGQRFQFNNFMNSAASSADTTNAGWPHFASERTFF